MENGCIVVDAAELYRRSMKRLLQQRNENKIRKNNN